MHLKVNISAQDGKRKRFYCIKQIIKTTHDKFWFSRREASATHPFAFLRTLDMSSHLIDSVVK